MKPTPISPVPSVTAAEYYEQLCAHLGMAVIATDRELNIQTWNAAAARIFGATAECMSGTPVLQIIPQARRGAAERMLRRAIELGETIQFEFQHRDEHGAARELACNIASVVLLSGERIGASICVRDITRRMDLQAELHESRKMASLGEMAGAVAHHFNNILGGAIVRIDYAQASENPLVRDKVLEEVQEALQRATVLVNGLLAFSAGDRRADDLGDFTEIISALVDEVERRLHGSSISFTVNLPRLPVLPVERVQVKTVLDHVVQNAIEAMPSGGGLGINVSLDGRFILVSVSDTGCGLDASARSRIFEPFWSTKGEPSSGERPAIGLGLAVAHGLVQMLGGGISVRSEVGKGSCFEIRLPRPDVDVADDPYPSK